MARSWYALVGAAALLIAGRGAGESGTSAAVALMVGALSISAAAWVRSASVPRGMLASVGIVVGALACTVPPLIVAMFMDTLGAFPAPLAYAGAAVPAAVGIGCGLILWRRSARPWE